MNRWIPWILILALACGGDGGPTGPDPETGVIRIVNSAAVPLVEVNISRCEIPVWGENRIDSPIAVGRSREFSLAPNCYDVRVEGADGGEVAFFDLTLLAGTVMPITIFSR